MTVKARFWVSEVKAIAHGSENHAYCHSEITMRPVYDDSNKSWSQATPSGELKMTITNSDAVKEFIPGATYELTFTKV